MIMIHVRSHLSSPAAVLGIGRHRPSSSHVSSAFSVLQAVASKLQVQDGWECVPEHRQELSINLMTEIE